MIILKTERDLEAMRPACAVAATVLDEVAAWIKPGISTREIDQYAAWCIKNQGAKSAFLGYRKYPCHICISINEQVVHGLAGDRTSNSGTSPAWMLASFIMALSATPPGRFQSADAESWHKNSWM